MDAIGKATAYLNMKPHTEKEVIDYLLRKGYSQEEAQSAAAELKDYRYIDDTAYAKMYFGYGFEKGRGKDRIVRELLNKGVSAEIIDMAYETLEEKPDEYEMARGIASQVVRESGTDPEEMDYAQKQKLQAKIARRLSSRGFSGSICFRAAREAVKD